MAEPHNTDPPYEDPYAGSDLSDRRRAAGMWTWIAGIAVVIVIAFIVAAFWNGDTQTASTVPVQTTGMGTAMHPTAPPATTGQVPGAPHVAPMKTAPAPATAPAAH